MQSGEAFSKPSQPVQSWATWMCRPATLLAALFAVAWAGKLLNPGETIEALAAGFGVSSLLASAFAGVVLSWDVLLVVWLLSGYALRACVGASLIFLLIATVFIARLWWIGHAGGCGCGLPSVVKQGTGVFVMACVRNGFMMALALMVWK